MPNPMCNKNFGKDKTNNLRAKTEHHIVSIKIQIEKYVKCDPHIKMFLPLTKMEQDFP